MKTFTDSRGDIIDFENGIQLITSKPNSRRASHYHKSSGHECIVTKGAVWYYERPVGSQEKPTLTIFGEQTCFYTGPNLEHLMVFHEDTDFVCVRTGGSLTPEQYEDDLVRFSHDLEEIYHASVS
jgi:hypothetical protein